MSVLSRCVRALPWLLASCLLVEAQAQRNWVYRIAAGPSPRLGAAMAFDSQRGVTVLFGGSNQPTTFQDTWEWDGVVWTQRTPATHPPSAGRFVYDSQRGVCVLVNNGGTWEWNGIDWAQRTTTGMSPYGLAYDPLRGRTVALMTVGGAITSPSTVMEWDGTTWTTVVSPTGPFYTVTGMCWHPGTQRVVAYTAFQGVSNPTAGARLWSWDGVVWTSSAQGVSSYCSGTVMTNHGNGISAYGGLSNTTPLVGLFGPPGTATETTVASPGGRVGHGLVWDSLRQRLVLFGGSFVTTIGSQLRGDTWEYVANTALATATPFGQGCGSPAPVLTAAAGTRPVLGTTFVADVANATLGATGMAWGLSGQGYFGSFQNLPIDMAPWGMTGCPMWTSSLGLQPCSLAGAATQFVMPVPNSGSLLAVQLDLQAFTFQAGANPRGIVVSNGLQLTVGDS